MPWKPTCSPSTGRRVSLASATQRSPRVAIVHLARCANGDAALQDFLSSYRELSPGVEHDLVVVLKGYEHNARSRKLALEALRLHRALTLEIPDEGLDLDAYRTAANAFEYSYYCFLNSFSRPSRGEWLNVMMHWAQQPGVGIVGASGSYQSFFTDYIDAFKDAFSHHLRMVLKGVGFDNGSEGVVKASFGDFGCVQSRTRRHAVAEEDIARGGKLLVVSLQMRARIFAFRRVPECAHSDQRVRHFAPRDRAVVLAAREHKARRIRPGKRQERYHIADNSHGA